MVFLSVITDTFYIFGTCVIVNQLFYYTFLYFTFRGYYVATPELPSGSYGAWEVMWMCFLFSFFVFLKHIHVTSQALEVATHTVKCICIFFHNMKECIPVLCICPLNPVSLPTVVSSCVGLVSVTQTEPVTQTGREWQGQRDRVAVASDNAPTLQWTRLDLSVL